MFSSCLTYFLFCWISFLIAHSLPIDSNQTNNSDEEDTLVLNVLWTSIKRHSNRTDVIRPSLCPSPCKRLFKARRVEQPVLGMDDREPSQEELCYCRCPTESPIFSQYSGQCVSKLDGCKRPIRVASAPVDPNSQWAPVVSLSKHNEIIRFPGQILWQESRVKLTQKQGPRCNITEVKVLRSDRQWIDTNRALFDLGWSDELNTGALIWNGTEDEREGLLGTLVQIQMNCAGAEPNSHCLTIRVSGELVFPNYSHPLFTNGGQNRIETVVIILLAILLFFTSFGYLILWKVRWRIKKSKLISALQMQFLYHMKQEKEKANEVAHHYQIFNGSTNPPMYPHLNNHQQPHKTPIYATNDMTIESQAEMMMHAVDQQPNPVLLAKRKLYFSAEFFEPHLMHNPPPMADQFLQDLRKMIDIAKQRINLRKHVQHLGTIAEEPPEIYQAYVRECRLDKRAPLTVTSSTSIRLKPSEESSPKSIKSIDSGHESTSSDSNNRGNDLSPSEDKKNVGSMKSILNSNLSVNSTRPRLGSNDSNKMMKNSKITFEDHHERPSSLQFNLNPQVSSAQHEFKRPFDMAPARKLTPQPHIPTPNAQNGIQVSGEGTTPPTSRIPTMNGLTLGQKSPRPIQKQPLTLSNQPSISLNGQQRSPNPQQISPKTSDSKPPPLPPRNPPTNPPKVVQQFIAQANRSALPLNQNGIHSKTTIQQHAEPITQVSGQHSQIPTNRSTEIKRKTYEVFPQDARLKKSLPRRSKKPLNKPQSNSTVTNNQDGVIETNM